MSVHRSFGDGFDGLQTAVLRAAVNPADWPDVIHALGGLFPGTRLQFWGTDQLRPTSSAQLQLGYDEDVTTTYMRHFQFINPWWPSWANTPVGKTISTSDAFRDAEMERTEFYNDWIRPQEDIIGGGGQVLIRDSTCTFYLAGNMPRRLRDKMQLPYLQTIDRIAPLIRHAIGVNRLMIAQNLELAAFRSGGEPTGTGQVLVDARRRLLYANPHGAAMLAAGQIIVQSPTGQISFVDGFVQARFDFLIRNRPKRISRLDAISHDRRRSAYLVPVDPDDLQRLVGSPVLSPSGPASLLLIRDDEVMPDKEAEIARTLGLTRSETLVAFALADGLSPSQISEIRQTSIHTVRNQVKTLLLKTATRRQSELVALIVLLRRTT